MNKLDCIIDYYNSNESLFLMLYSITYNERISLDIFNNSDYVKGAKVGTIASLLLDIREDMLEKPEQNYESKIKLDKLIECVELIATKTNNGYMIDNYLFKSANEVVSTVRNKMAHGDYVINFKDNRVVLNIENKEVRINIDKLALFIVQSLQSILINENCRSIMKFDNNFDRSPLKLKSEFKNVIKHFKNITYNIESSNGEIPTNILEYFSNQIYLYKNGRESNAIEKGINNLNSMGYKVNVLIKHINPNLVDNVCNYIMNDTNINEFSYEEQLQYMGPIIQRYIDKSFNKFNVKYSNFKILLFLDKIKRTSPTNTNQLIKSITDEYGFQEIGFDLLGTSTINMFNSLFVYPFDDLYKNNNEYTEEPNNGLDYSKLNLSMLNIIMLNNDENTIINEKSHNNSVEKNLSDIIDKINDSLHNLSCVKEKNNEQAIYNISKNIEKLKNDKQELLNKLFVSNSKLKVLNTYYDENKLYFKNKAIIEGIRNSIAHGNYEIVCNREFDDAKLIFSDIYEGKLTFKAEIPIKEFGMLLEKNTDVIQEFIDSKKAKSKIR